MEHLPVEVIGYILSLLSDSAKDVIVASATCKKWLEARHNHLHALCFYYDFLPQLPTHELEIIITKNILQTKGLQSLSILMDFDDVFSAAAVISCIVRTRDTLRNLHIRVATSPSINFLEICNRQKLEELSLAYNSVEDVGPIYMKFPALKSLSLVSLSISSLNLSLLITMCPKLEALSLFNLDITNSDGHAAMKLSSASLKDISIECIDLESFKLDKFILETASIETVHLDDCTLKHFELVGKGSLKVLWFKDVSVFNLDIGGNTCNLEVVDISCTGDPDAYNYTIMWPKLYHMISRSSKLRKLRLWDIVFSEEDDVVNLENIAIWFPQLSQLSLRYGLRDGRLHYGMEGSSNLENVTVLEVGWTVINKPFTNWVDGLLQRCPRLKKLVIYGIIPVAITPGDCLVLADFTTAIVGLMRKYIGVDVQFNYREN